MAYDADGGVMQSGLTVDPADYEPIAWPVLGMVLEMRAADHPENRSAVFNSSQRGHFAEATVQVLHDGTDTGWIIPHVVILPTGASGVDDYEEDLPRAASMAIDGSRLDTGLRHVNPYALDGDLCVVQFIGGDVQQPFLSHWWPHPGNIVDPATSGHVGTLEQGRRWYKRKNGTKALIAADGTYRVDTTEANSTIEPSRSGPVRKKLDPGGDIRFDPKPGRKFEVNFNAPVDDPAEPSMPQRNPPLSQTSPTRADTSTRWTLTKDDVQAIAAQVAQLMSRQGTGAGLRLEQGNAILAGNALLGATVNPTTGAVSNLPTERSVLGDRFMGTFNALVSVVNALITAYNDAAHLGAHLAPVPPFTQTGTSMTAQDLAVAAKVR